MKSVIHYTTEGDQSNHPLIFIHGLCWTNKIWDSIIDDLKEAFYLVLIDLPGHGKSGKLTDYSFKEVSEEINQLLLSLNLPDKVSIVGSSIGASIGLVYSSIYNNVKNLYLVDGGYYPLSETKNLSWSDIENGSLPASIFESQSNFIEFMKGDNPSLWNDSIERAVLDQITWNNDEKKYQFLISDEEQIKYMKSEWELVPELTLNQISKSVKIILMVALNESTDTDLSMEYASRMKRIHPNTKLVVFEDTDHLIMLDAKKRFTDEILKLDC
ncbi:alpha/beta hydrolase [Cytobacillus spongiae]|uniref:alpha/beta fold hydrolase n=1 Tax=Cytobacillus spongiae TaxID=2901381 RepID=UPI001F166B9D|nr:alpha/beta hydrolase [Cytobacillus spongiae]UII54183.1 alpha/beta hydrolase [Cytobacillus spongiae]